MSNMILLARPHPFIVTGMKPFLEANGFSPKKLEKYSDLSAQITGASGAIISLAVESSIKESMEQVYAEVRRVSPALPLMFAGMLGFSAMKGTLRRLAKSEGVEAELLGMDAESENHPGLGKLNTFLYISNVDLAEAGRRKLAARIVQRHFKRT